MAVLQGVWSKTYILYYVSGTIRGFRLHLLRPTQDKIKVATVQLFKECFLGTEEIARWLSALVAFRSSQVSNHRGCGLLLWSLCVSTHTHIVGVYRHTYIYTLCMPTDMYTHCMCRHTHVHTLWASTDTETYTHTLRVSVDTHICCGCLQTYTHVHTQTHTYALNT